MCATKIAEPRRTVIHVLLNVFFQYGFRSHYFQLFINVSYQRTVAFIVRAHDFTRQQLIVARDPESLAERFDRVRVRAVFTICKFIAIR